jgi:hypothetical protein
MSEVSEERFAIFYKGGVTRSIHLSGEDYELEFVISVLVVHYLNSVGY